MGRRRLQNAVTPVPTDNAIRSAKPGEKPYKMGDSLPTCDGLWDCARHWLKRGRGTAIDTYWDPI
jgi:hypothetical protein